MIQPCGQPAHPKFWTVHVHGPDDVVLCDTDAEAHAYAAAITDLTRRGGPLAVRDQFDPHISAHVIAPVSGVQEGSNR